MCSLPRRWRLLLATIALATPLAASVAVGQSGVAAPTVEAFLVRQDSSDCANSDVKADDPSRIGGAVQISRQPDGQLHVKVAITGAPNTVYHFFLKCVMSLGDIKTEDEGEGNAEFTFAAPSSSVLTFDMYPEGAPAGQKFQSTPAKLP